MACEKSLWGSMPPFDHEKDNWRIYKGRLEQFFKTFGMEDGEKKKSALLSYCGGRTYNLLYGLCSPKDPGDLTYTELCAMLETHFIPPVILFQERKKFYEAAKLSSESGQDFILRLRGIATNCEFGERLDELLKDKFVTGMDGKVFDRLCEENVALDLKKALEITKKYELRQNKVAMESDCINVVAGRRQQENARRENPNRYGNNTKPETSSFKRYNNFNYPNYNKSSNAVTFNPCIHCGYTNHLSNNCKFRDSYCSLCGNRGHINRVCQNKVQSQHKAFNRELNSVKEGMNTKANSINIVDGRIWCQAIKIV